MDFPARPGIATNIPNHLFEGLGITDADVLRARDYLVVLESEEEVRSIQPNFEKLAKVDCTGIIVTAPGEDVDFVSRFFAPQFGVPEDPVTGSAHCTLAPYWSEVLGKNELTARQVSERGGELACKLVGERVHIAGRAVLYSRGVLATE